MIGTFYNMTGSVVAFVIPLPMSLPLLSALLLSLSAVLCIIGIRIVFAILILLLLRFMRLLKNIFFSKQTEMTMTKCHILRSRKAQQIWICNDVILKICRDKYCKSFIPGSVPFLPWLCLTGPITKAVTLKQRFAILQNWNFFQRHISLCITDSWSKGTLQPITSGTNHVVQIASWCIFSNLHNSYIFLARESYVNALIYVYDAAFICNY